MMISVVTLAMTVVISNWPLGVHSSQNAMQTLQDGASHLAAENPSNQVNRDDEETSNDYISNLLSNIKNVIRFLEERPDEATARERLLLEDLQRIRKNEQINRLPLPFTQHNFIRFGKRYASNEDIKSQQDQKNFDQASISSIRDLEDFLSRIPDTSSSPLLEPFSENSDAMNDSDQSDLADSNIAYDNPEKRQYHNFVRIGKGAQEKRQYHNFVRIGRIIPEKKPHHNFVRIGREAPEKRQYHSFVRIGRRVPDRQRHNFVRFGKRFPEKRQHHSFVRFGK